ncbi:MAG: hypothetical protein ACRCRT_03795 [Cetobacterium somerae]
MPVEEKEAMEGDSIILPTGLTELQTNKIKWYYQDEKNCIAEINGGEKKEFPGADERFRGKLKLDVNGNLTITDIRRIHSGLYILEIHNNEKMKECKIFAVSVKGEFMKSLCLLTKVSFVNNLDDQKLTSQITEL